MFENYHYSEHKNCENVITEIVDDDNNIVEEDNRDDRFMVLPEAYDIFQNIDFKKIISVSSRQKQFAFDCLGYMDKNLKRRFIETGITKVLPKLYLVVEEDKALTIHWDYVNYRIYLDIEKDISKSFYGIISKNAAKGFSTSTGQLSENNYPEVIDSIIAFVFAN